MPPAVEVQSLNHWTTREVPYPLLLKEADFRYDKYILYDKYIQYLNEGR